MFSFPQFLSVLRQAARPPKMSIGALGEGHDRALGVLALAEAEPGALGLP